MRRIVTVIMNIGLVISAIFGFGHFFIPYAFNWNDYMKEVPKYIVVSIDWINFFFSLFLLGNSVLLIIYQNQIKQRDKIALSFYGFLVFTYFCKSIITFIHPWGMNQIVDLIEKVSSLFELLLLLLPLIYFLKIKKVVGLSNNNGFNE
jgi:hypothetical protein